jgi:hypothetical protein
MDIILHNDNDKDDDGHDDKNVDGDKSDDDA